MNTISTFDLWHKGDSFIVGVSGGPDSLCLLDVLWLLQKKYDFTLSVAHMNYHLRGKDSDRDAALAKQTALRYGLPATVASRKPKSTASEETLRALRYAFFETLRRKTGATHIAVAHNQDDQAETLLLRLLRGTGLAGLAAMRPKHNAIIRPLIEMSRADILRYLKERGIAFREDSSNQDPRYFRNRVRHELIPLLEQHFQPQARTLLAETAMLLGDDYAFLESLSPSLAVERGAASLEFSRAAALEIPETLLRYTLRAWLRPLLAGQNPSKNLLGELIKALKSSKNKMQTVTFQGLKFIRKGDTVRLLYRRAKRTKQA
ncbi:MAG: tRNA lysidine(34) synthetase TilS [Candidatus Moranbacteria bacterium RIFCSPHIGHO2_01_FULL_54_31]|nr:MAG: tRNA lysidine(34) synthetase TilS [Candidatus Moranbacteria bacterium RIFCSPHIGHO2_01_FULL_54_31]